MLKQSISLTAALLCMTTCTGIAHAFSSGEMSFDAMLDEADLVVYASVQKQEKFQIDSGIAWMGMRHYVRTYFNPVGKPIKGIVDIKNFYVISSEYPPGLMSEDPPVHFKSNIEYLLILKKVRDGYDLVDPESSTLRSQDIEKRFKMSLEQLLARREKTVSISRNIELELSLVPLRIVKGTEATLRFSATNIGENEMDLPVDIEMQYGIGLQGWMGLSVTKIPDQNAEGKIAEKPSKEPPDLSNPFGSPRPAGFRLIGQGHPELVRFIPGEPKIWEGTSKSMGLRLKPGKFRMVWKVGPAVSNTVEFEVVAPQEANVSP